MGGAPCGVVLVAFRTDRLSREILLRLLKGLGVAVFFVSLILVQNIIGRRDKLRLRRLDEELGAARAQVAAALAGPPASVGMDIGVTLLQEGGAVSGVRYELGERPGGGLELLLIVPERGGLAGAFASVIFGELYRRSAARGEASPAACLRGLLAEYGASPQARPLLLLLVRVAPDGAVDGATCGLPTPLCLESGAGEGGAAGAWRPLETGAREAGEASESTEAGEAAPSPFAPAPRSFTAPAGSAAVAVLCDGRPGDRPAPAAAPGPASPADALDLLAAGLCAGRPAQTLAKEAAALTRRRHRRRAGEDVFVLLIGRGPAGA